MKRTIKRKAISALFSFPCAVALTLVVAAMQLVSGIKWEADDVTPWD